MGKHGTDAMSLAKPQTNAHTAGAHAINLTAHWQAPCRGSSLWGPRQAPHRKAEGAVNRNPKNMARRLHSTAAVFWLIVAWGLIKMGATPLDGCCKQHTAPTQ